MTTVTRGQRGEETPELQTSPPHPSMLGAAGGQHLDTISTESRADESREGQQDTSNISTGEEQSGNMRPKPKQKTVEDCDARKETLTGNINRKSQPHSRKPQQETSTSFQETSTGNFNSHEEESDEEESDEEESDEEESNEDEEESDETDGLQFSSGQSFC